MPVPIGSSEPGEAQTSAVGMLGRDGDRRGVFQASGEGLDRPKRQQALSPRGRESRLRAPRQPWMAEWWRSENGFAL